MGQGCGVPTTGKEGPEPPGLACAQHPHPRPSPAQDRRNGINRRCRPVSPAPSAWSRLGDPRAAGAAEASRALASPALGVRWVRGGIPLLPGGPVHPPARAGPVGLVPAGQRGFHLLRSCLLPACPPRLGSLDCPGSVSSSLHPCVSSPPTLLPSFPVSRFLFVVSLSLSPHPHLSHVLCVCAFLFLSAGVTSPQF